MRSTYYIVGSEKGALLGIKYIIATVKDRCDVPTQQSSSRKVKHKKQEFINYTLSSSGSDTEVSVNCKL